MNKTSKMYSCDIHMNARETLTKAALFIAHYNIVLVIKILL